MKNSGIFISYAWEDDVQAEWVSRLAELLKKAGFDPIFDRDLDLGDDITKFMETVRAARFVLLICTPSYAKKANAREGGVGYETKIITAEMYEASGAPGKFIPILKSGDAVTAIPTYLGKILYQDFRDESALRADSAPMQKLIAHFKKFSDECSPSGIVGKSPQGGIASAREILEQLFSGDLYDGIAQIQRLTRSMDALRSTKDRESFVRYLRDWFCSPPKHLDPTTPNVREARRETLRFIREQGSASLKQYFDARKLEGIDLVDMDFSKADIAGVSFAGSFLILSDFSESDLSGANLSSCSVRNVNFGKAILKNVNFHRTDWFNSLGLCLAQMQEVRPATLQPMPRNIDDLHRFLRRAYAIPFDKWKPSVQHQLLETWATYLGEPELLLSFLSP